MVTNDITITSIDPESSVYYRNSISSLLNTIITPATNVNGVIIFAMSLFAENQTNPDVSRIMLKTSAPNAWNDSDAIGIGISGESFVSLVSLPVFIGPGLGLYEQASGATFSSGAEIAYIIK